MHGHDAESDTSGGAALPAIEVVRSSGRVRTSSARVRDGRIVIRLPAHLSARDADRATGDLLTRLRAKATSPGPISALPRRVSPVRATRGARGPRGDHALVERADRVAATRLPDHDVRPGSVTWSHRMTTRWASITLRGRRVRVSHRLADAPEVVLDVLLLHELAHVVEGGHGPAFRALVGRHPDHADVEAWLARRTHDELRTALGLSVPPA